MRKRRLLLAATALSAACKGKGEERQPLPGNPKGSVYDAQALEPQPLPGNPKGSMYDAAEPPPLPPDAATADAGAPADAVTKKVPTDAPVIRPLPGNPKGSLYDKGKPKKVPIDD